MDKRGLELAISSLILIVLAIVILLALILAFTGGFQKFWNQVTNLFPSDVASIKSTCQVACNAGQVYDFCERERSVRDLGKITCNNPAVNISCIDITC